jgi:hypothetical protein
MKLGGYYFNLLIYSNHSYTTQNLQVNHKSMQISVNLDISYKTL